MFVALFLGVCVRPFGRDDFRYAHAPRGTLSAIVVPLVPALQPSERLYIGALQLVLRRSRALLASVTAAVFARELLHLCRRGFALAPLPVLEDDLVASRAVIRMKTLRSRNGGI